jgi:AraC-like DNA-binding protein/tetratricopeptide (TPR) repeat protein
MPAQPLPHHVKKAIDLLKADLGRGWKIDELARFCAVPRRTLEKHFKLFIGQAPLEFLNAERLNKARRQLLVASPGASVTQVAMACGFNHLGRFSIVYRERHGESPSETIRRRSVILRRGSIPPRLSAAAERPALAVLPIDLIGPHALCVGAIRDEMTAALHRSGWIKIVSAPSGRYHLQINVSDDGAGVLRIRMTLLDRAKRCFIWMDSSQYAVRDLYGASDWIALRAAGALRSVLRDAEIDHAARKDPTELMAWRLCMRALPAVLAADLTTEAPAEILERAIELAPHDPVPVSLSAWCHGLRAAHHLAQRPSDARDRSLQLASRGSALCSGDALSSTVLAAAYSLAGQLPEAERHVRHALAIDAGSAWAWGRLAWIHAYRDESADAIECFQIARALGPSDPLGFLWFVGIGAANFELGHYSRATSWYRRALAEQPKALWINRFLAPTLALAGQKEEGLYKLHVLLRSFPALTIARVRTDLPHTARTWDRFSDGLASLGIAYSE